MNTPPCRYFCARAPVRAPVSKACRHAELADRSTSLVMKGPRFESARRLSLICRDFSAMATVGDRRAGTKRVHRGTPSHLMKGSPSQSPCAQSAGNSRLGACATRPMGSPGSARAVPRVPALPLLGRRTAWEKTSSAQPSDDLPVTSAVSPTPAEHEKLQRGRHGRRRRALHPPVRGT